MSGPLQLMMCAGAAPITYPDFALYNGSGEVQGYAFDGSDITTVGDPAAVAGVSTSSGPNRCAVRGDSGTSIIIAASDNFNDFILARYSYGGAGWGIVGSALTSPKFLLPRIGALQDSQAVIGTTSATDVRIYTHDGSTWSEDVDSAGTQCYSKVGLSSSVFINAASSDLIAREWNGSTISTGDTLDISGTSGADLARLTATTFVHIDANGDLQTYQYTGSTLASVGNPLSVTASTYNSLCAISETRIVHGSATAGTLQAYDFDGSDWSAVGNSLSVAIPEGNNLGSLLNYPV